MPETLIDRAFLEKLERLALRWQKSFAGHVGGHNISRFSGAGQEFLDHRHFHHGDDLRAVNWRAYLRLEKLFLKMFQVEPRVPVRILIDTSSSMNAGRDTKLDYARLLAAALCYIGLVRLDTICIQPFSSSLGDSHIASGGRHRFAPAVNFITGLQAGGRTRFFDIARELVAKFPQRGLLIILSDFLDDGDCERPLQFLADFGHELMLLQLWSPEDREPPWEGQLELIDSESGDTLDVPFDAEARHTYTTAFDEYSGRIERIALRTGGRYAGLATTTKIEEAVFGPLVHSGSVE